MFTAELKVNGVLVSVLYGHRSSESIKGSPARYECTLHRLGRLEVRAAEVDHFPELGLDALVSKALEKLNRS